MLPTHRQPIHPGEILLEEFLKPLELTTEDLATHLEIPTQQMNEIIKGDRGITPEIAWFFSQAFQTSPEFWMNLQTHYDLCLRRPKLRKSAIA